MADIAKKYVDLTQLSYYDGKIKGWANSANQVAFKTVIKSTDGNSLYFYKKPGAVENTDTPDATISLGNADANVKLAALGTFVGATYNDVTKTWSFTGLDNSFDATTVVAALNELHTDIAAVASDLADLEAKVGEIPEDATATTVVGYAAEVADAAEQAAKDYTDDKIDALDTTADLTIASKTGKAITVTADIAEEDGVIKKGQGTDITFADVASTGAAEDVTNTAINGVTKDVSGTPVSTTNVQDTLEALKNLIDNADSDATLYAIETAGGLGSDILKAYELIQGGTPTIDQVTGKVTAVTGGTTVTNINIPKDYLVKNAEVKTVAAADKTAGGIFENDDAFAVGDKYIDFTVNTADGTGSGTEKHLYLNVDDLMAALSVEADATEIQLVLSATNQLSASVVDIAASKITYIAADATEGIARESVGAALTRLDADDTTTGSVRKIAKDAATAAVTALDTTSDVAIATVNGTTGAVTIAGSVSETDGIIGDGSADTVTLTPITQSEIDALFTVAP